MCREVGGRLLRKAVADSHVNIRIICMWVCIMYSYQEKVTTKQREEGRNCNRALGNTREIKLVKGASSVHQFVDTAAG